jgi:hypothetical protein
VDRPGEAAAAPLLAPRRRQGRPDPPPLEPALPWSCPAAAVEVQSVMEPDQIHAAVEVPPVVEPDQIHAAARFRRCRGCSHVPPWSPPR